MQETSNDIAVLSPAAYDWSEFDRKERGFLSGWCSSHQHSNGEEFNYKTVYALVKGDYVSGAGPKIKEIIRAALQEALITEILSEAA